MNRSISTWPRHVAAIMDGNRRWAAAHGLPASLGHLQGLKAIRAIVERAARSGIDYLTLFAFSSENWLREGREVRCLMRLLRFYLARETTYLREHNVRLRCIGELGRLDADLQQRIVRAEQETAASTGLCLTLAISYGGQDEILHATREIARRCVNRHQDPETINHECIRNVLFASPLPPVDLLIRTGGEQRISNFLLWHIAYAELLFIDKLWPEFTATDFEDCLQNFAQRSRRFGT